MYQETDLCGRDHMKTLFSRGGEGREGEGRDWEGEDRKGRGVEGGV